MIENGIASIDIAQKIDKRNLIGLGARDRAHDEVESAAVQARPTIRPDHRGLIMNKGSVWKATSTVGLTLVVTGKHPKY